MVEGRAYGFFISELPDGDLLDALLRREDAAHIPYLEFKFHDLNGRAQFPNVPQKLIDRARRGGMERFVEATLPDSNDLSVANYLAYLFSNVLVKNQGVAYVPDDGNPRFVHEVIDHENRT